MRWRATRRVHEAALQRFLRLLALALPADPERAAASAEPVAQAPALTMGETPRPPAQAGTTGETPKPPARAAKAPVARPAPRKEPEVEVLVVRRRPAAASPSSTPKPGSPSPRAGR